MSFSQTYLYFSSMIPSIFLQRRSTFHYWLLVWRFLMFVFAVSLLWIRFVINTHASKIEVIFNADNFFFLSLSFSYPMLLFLSCKVLCIVINFFVFSSSFLKFFIDQFPTAKFLKEFFLFVTNILHIINHSFVS